MTEREWLACDKLEPMLRYIWPKKRVPKGGAHASPRKLMLWAESACMDAVQVARLLDVTLSTYTSGFGTRPGMIGNLSERVRVNILRDIVGNPFRPYAKNEKRMIGRLDVVNIVDQFEVTDLVLSIARGVYNEDDFCGGCMPVLSDALEEAGCADEDVLRHCRRDGPHWKGCWVVDLILGYQ